MSDKQLLQWAIKGITAEIDELEKTVRKGQKLLVDIREGKQVKTPLSEYDILDIIKAKKKRIEKLSKEKTELSWQLDVE